MNCCLWNETITLNKAYRPTFSLIRRSVASLIPICFGKGESSDRSRNSVFGCKTVWSFFNIVLIRNEKKKTNSKNMLITKNTKLVVKEKCIFRWMWFLRNFESLLPFRLWQAWQWPGQVWRSSLAASYYQSVEQPGDVPPKRTEILREPIPRPQQPSGR